MIWKSLIIFILIFSSTIFAEDTKNHLLVLGGGGEPAKPGTIFDGVLKLLTKYHASTSWESTAVTFNGGHSDTELILKNFSKDINGFTGKNYQQTINKYIEMMDNIDGKGIKENEQIIIYIDTHGYEKKDKVR